jgi:carbamoyltransferase
MKILGISNAHDSNVCILEDGEVLLHVEKERLTRVRYDEGSMEEFLPEILKNVGLTIDDIDLVATSIPVWKDMPTTGKMIGGGYTSSTSYGVGEMIVCGKKIPAYNIAHHLGHIALSYYMSPFEEADVISIDGGGNFTFGLLAKGQDTHFDFIADLENQNIGWLWNALAGRIFGSMAAAGKVMGLAPYGKPAYVNDLYSEFGEKQGDITWIKMKEFPDHTKPIPFHMIGCKNVNNDLTSEEENMASSLQKITNEMALDIIKNYLPKEKRSKNLCISGGVALNCVMNDVIQKSGLYENIYVPSAPNDAGLSIGFAQYLWHTILGNQKISKHRHPYLGLFHNQKEIEIALDKAKQSNRLKITHIPKEVDQNKKIVELLIDQKIIGIHRERSESGPRALGHRSIIADPRDHKMKDIINSKVKFREAFRPFAPSILREKANQYLDFEGYSPYMSFAPKVKEAAYDMMGATIHVDGSARLQTVDPENNPDFYRLIKAFYKSTGVPVVLNTSLNTRGEPINETPLHSLNTLLDSDLDALLIDDYLFEKM